MNDDLILEDNWTGAEGANANGIPVMVRYRQNIREFIDTGSYPTKIEISWLYDTDEAAEMPTPGEATVMENFEAALIAALEGDKQSILVAVMTGQGEKHWQWYTANARMAQERIDMALLDFETLPININTKEDPNWNDYFDFIADFGGAA
ncbi:DUF695 domain-containing protein [Mucilaginibacter pedocola]|uniref:DUF695 domain-containing protein n=1 Tax=Mucilaginibacter pedocola TaxID=1792845 RepID=A0A1S9PEB8_9SPHI|nr:DUF695 domain-containing protein [Mucilaginibacter pedocola]OOQ59249.1 hypothetical protein BC343_28420 [Mucilaginibacter pedocola]